MPLDVKVDPKQEEELKRTLYYGEKAQQKEENFGKIEIAYKEKDVTKFVLRWLKNNKIRTPSTIQDFFDQVDEYVEIINKEDKQKNMKRLEKRLSSGEKYRDYIQDRRKVFEEIIDDQDQKMDIDSLPPELDAVVASDINYAREMIKRESKKANQILQSFQIKSRKFNTRQRMEIYEKMKDIIFSILIVNFRIVEIFITFETTSDLSRHFELLEWDINTLQLTRFSLNEYIDSLLQKTWDRKWTDDFTEDTIELIKLFRS